jgi:serine/threonine protein kinase/Tfp pilus assembly protein PilF
VYLAQDTRLDRKVALKILPAEVAANQDRMRRFVQEAKAASALNHPNIITIYEIEQSDSVNFIATEFVDGETLRERMRNAPMKLGEVLDVAAQIASALSAAHAAGIIHRDIKPDNIMTRRDGIAKVLDFGLAKLTEGLPPDSVDTEAPTSFKTDPGTVVGTIVYMSPEQARGLQLDARTDIFSLGVLIYEMVAGRLPFEGSNENEVLASILGDKEPAPLARYAQAVPVELERIVAKALRKSRDERYQTVKDLLLDLKALKQELEFEAKLERSIPPKARVSLATGSRGQSGTTIDQSVASTVQVSQAHPTSSVEYLVAGIKQSKVGAIVVLIVVAAGIVGLAAYLRARNTEVAIESIAVLPFVNTSGDANTEYLSDGIAETLINSLSQLQQLRVVARSTAFRYKGKEIDPQAVGRDLNVRAVLMGRVRQAGDSLNIQVDLVDTTTGAQLWGQEYERRVSDLLSVKQEIAREITERLRLRLSGEEQKQLVRHDTTNSDAYQLYLKGRYWWEKRTEEGFKKSIEHFNQAIEKDPNYALAYAGLADSYSLLPRYGFFSAKESFPRAKAAAMKALELDDTLAEAHASLAYVKTFYDWDWPGAETGFKRALELNPNYATAHHWYALYLTVVGRQAEGLAEIEHARELEPLSLIINTNAGRLLYYARQDDKAIEQYKKTIELNPTYGEAHLWLGKAYLQKSLYPEALAELQEAVNLSKDNPVMLAALGYAYSMSGRRTETQKIVDQLQKLSKQKYVSPNEMAVLYIGLNEKDHAFESLEKAYEERSALLTYLRVEPQLYSLRSDPRFADLVRRIGLPQ